jgi:hypothetical protein
VNLDHLTRAQLEAVIRRLAYFMALEMAGSDAEEEWLTEKYIEDAVRAVAQKVSD